MASDNVSELWANWVDHRSPREIQYQNTAKSLHDEEGRVATEISVAAQAGDVDALARLLPRREAVAFLLQELKTEEQALESIRTAEREADERRNQAEAAVFHHAQGTRRMALTQAQQLNEKWRNFVPLAGNFSGKDKTPEEAWKKAKAEYDKLVGDYDLKDWEIQGQMAGRERGW